MSTQVASLFGLLSLRDEMTPALRQGRRSLLDFGGQLQAIGGQVSSLGGAMTAIGAPISAAFGLAVRESNTFNASLTNIGAVLGLTQDQIKDLSGELLEIGGNRRAGPQAVAEAFYDIVGGVADASTHMAILNAALDTAEAGSANLTATTQGLISAMNSYGFEADQAAYVSDIFTRTVGVGVGTMDEFVSAMGPILGITAQTGVSLTETGAAMGFLTTKGFSASQSATRLQAAITAIIKPNEQMKTALAAAGLESGSAALANLGLVETLRRLSIATGGSTDELAAALGTTEALGAALALTGEDFRAFGTNFAEGLDGATAAAQGIQNMSDQARLDLLSSQMSELAITTGGALVPALLQIVDAVRPIIDNVIAWVKENPELIAQIGMIAGGLAVAGPILIAVGAAISGIGAIIGLVLSPIGAVVAAVAGLALAWETNFLGIRDTLQPVVDAVVNGIGSIITTVQDWINQNPEFVLALGIAGVAVAGITATLSLATGAFGLVSGAVGVLSGALGVLFSPVILVAAAIAGLLYAVQELYPGGLAGVLRDAATSAQQLAAVFSFKLFEGLNKAATAASQLWAIFEHLIDSGNTLAHMLGLGVKSDVSSGIIGRAQSLIAGRTDGAGFASGNFNVNRPMVAQLHTGEAVLSAPDADQWRRGQSGGGGMQIGNVTIYANSYEQGRAAADGFEARINELYASRGN